MATKRVPKKHVSKQETALHAKALFVDRKGKAYPVSDETCPIAFCNHGEKKGATCGTHSCFAHAYGLKHDIDPSETATDMSAGTAGDFDPYECELINRGWTRARCVDYGGHTECDFTVKERDKTSLWNAWMVANAHKSDSIIIERLTVDGLTDARPYHNPESLMEAAELAGYNGSSGQSKVVRGILITGALALIAYVGAKLTGMINGKA